MNKKKIRELTLTKFGDQPDFVKRFVGKNLADIVELTVHLSVIFEKLDTVDPVLRSAFLKTARDMLDEYGTKSVTPTKEPKTPRARKKRTFTLKECPVCKKQVKGLKLHYKYAHDPKARKEMLKRITKAWDGKR